MVKTAQSRARLDVSAAAVLIRKSGAILLVGLVSDATRAHERAYPLYDGKPYNWRRIARNRVAFNHDATQRGTPTAFGLANPGMVRAELWHSVY